VLTLAIVMVAARPEGHRQGTEAFAYPGHLFALSMVDRCLCLQAREFTPGATPSPPVPEIFSRAAALTLVIRPPFHHAPPSPGGAEASHPPRGVQGPTRPRPSTLNGQGNGVP
jgi:hypothetical protein